MNVAYSSSYIFGKQHCEMQKNSILCEYSHDPRLMREIILDTETTGLDPKSGHKIVEIGCVEVVNLIPTGRVWHQYINPEREVPAEAFAVHGLSYGFLKSYPTIREVLGDFVAFLAEDPVVIHNAGFDMKFLNAEFLNHNIPLIASHRVIDTLMMARKKFPGSPASLDALCRRFQVDNTSRDKHGALLDATLLADVYLQLRGGKQPALYSETQESATRTHEIVRLDREHRTFTPSAQDHANHLQFVESMKAPLWKTILPVAKVGGTEALP